MQAAGDVDVVDIYRYMYVDDATQRHLMDAIKPVFHRGENIQNADKFSATNDIHWPRGRILVNHAWAWKPVIKRPPHKLHGAALHIYAVEIAY